MYGIPHPRRDLWGCAGICSSVMAAGVPLSPYLAGEESAHLRVKS